MSPKLSRRLHEPPPELESMVEEGTLSIYVVFCPAQESKQRKTARGLYLVIKKKEAGPYWSRLTSDSRKVPYIHTDFNRWKDEDEDDSDEDGPGSDPSMQAVRQYPHTLTLVHLFIVHPPLPFRS